MQKHTQGPWGVNDAGPESGNVIRFEIDAPNGVRICDIEDPAVNNDADAMSSEQAEANARLISAAPELLQVCRQIVAAVDAGHLKNFSLSFVIQARAALAKAAELRVKARKGQDK